MSQQVKIPDELHATLKELAKMEDRSIVAVLRRAVDLYKREQDEGWLSREELEGKEVTA